MIEEWQQILYPLGLLSTIFFGFRFCLQWWVSERAGRSIVPKNFWHFSIVGNLSLALHSVIQLQLPMVLLQGAQAVLAKRNIELLSSHRPSKKRLVLQSLVVLGSLLAIFSWISFQKGEWEWMRTPSTPWSNGTFEVPLSLEILGIIGLVLFSSRFFVQWWEAEKQGESRLSPSFWILTLSGALLSTLYFWYILDFVNLLGPIFGAISAARNLTLSYRR